MKLYIVGGAVRDIFLGTMPTDVDIVFDGAHEHMTDIAHVVGKSVRVFLHQGREYTPLKGASIKEDLHSRDLTINAIALPLGDAEGSFYAHPFALHDLAQGILRPTSQTAFFDDPLRLYRVARFAATLTQSSGAYFSVHESAIMQARAVVRQGLHKSIPAERIGREVMKALQGSAPMRFFDIVMRMGALKPWFQEITPAHVLSLRHITAACPLTQWLSVCMPFAHYNNEHAAKTMAERLCLAKKFIDGGRIMASCHKAGLHYPSLSVSEQCDLLSYIDKFHLSSVFWNVALHPASADALRALAIIQAVRLPKELQNLGKASGEHLRMLKCAALEREF